MTQNQDIQCQTVVEYAKDDNGPWSFLIVPLNSATWSDGRIQEWTLIANKNEQADKNACVKAAMNAYAELGDIRWNYVPECFQQTSLFPDFTLPDGKEPADQEQYSGSWWLTPLPNPALESTSQDTSDRHWGFLISPIDLTAGSTDDQLVVWENRYIRDARSYESRKVCEEQALIYAKDNPPGYNMAVKCVSPPPGMSAISVIDGTDLNLTIDE